MFLLVDARSRVTHLDEGEVPSAYRRSGSICKQTGNGSSQGNRLLLFPGADLPFRCTLAIPPGIEHGIMEVMQIHIPTPLRSYTDKQETVSVTGGTVNEALAALIAAYPAIEQHLYTPEGKLRSFVNLYLNDEDVRYLPAKEQTTLSAADELTIVPSIAGGCCTPACCCR
jgi:adenylyltransferase/sulfurtransferase